ncbi:MAG: hypothetical protein U0235_21815 [Polyangiaceae bacterium]
MRLGSVVRRCSGWRRWVSALRGDAEGAGIASACDPAVDCPADASAAPIDASTGADGTASDASTPGADAAVNDAQSGTDATLTDASTTDAGLGDASSDAGAASDASDACVPVTSAIHYVKVVHRLRSGYCALDDVGAVRCWRRVRRGSVHARGDLGRERVPHSHGDARARRRRIDIGAGQYLWCALKSNGDVYCWGRTTWASSAIRRSPAAARVAPGKVGARPRRRYKSLSVAPEHTCVILDDQTARCRGSNFLGVLGHAGIPCAPRGRSARRQ